MRRHHRSMIHILSNVNPHPVNAAEVGVFTGDLSADLLRAFPELHLYLLWMPSVLLQNLIGVKVYMLISIEQEI